MCPLLFVFISLTRRTLNTEISVLEASVYVDRQMSTAFRCNSGISLPYAADTSSDVSV